MVRKLVILVGSNPSTSSPDCSAFHPDTKSRKALDGWLEGIDAEFKYVNISDSKLASNRPLNNVEIQNHLESLKVKIADGEKVIAVGNTADKALNVLKRDHVKVPHPSGRNRILNDSNEIVKIKEKLRNYING